MKISFGISWNCPHYFFIYKMVTIYISFEINGVWHTHMDQCCNQTPLRRPRERNTWSDVSFPAAKNKPNQLPQPRIPVTDRCKQCIVRCRICHWPTTSYLTGRLNASNTFKSQLSVELWLFFNKVRWVDFFSLNHKAPLARENIHNRFRDVYVGLSFKECFGKSWHW